MTDELRVEIDGRAGRLRLNRPRAIHALTTSMCSAMIAALSGWADDPAIALVLIDHAEGRGFCAGGDVRAAAADPALARAFFHEEYRLNHQLFTYPKPILAFMDGITMGGGVGISQPARYRIATENTLFAMPETGIGLFPDVGGGWYLSRLPGHMGEYLALTGARLDGAECLALGLATHYLPSRALAGLKARLGEEPDAIAQHLAAASVPPPEAEVIAHREAIDRLFAGATLEAILAALADDPSQWARATLATLKAKSPESCKVSLRVVREGRTRASFADEMAAEFAVAVHVSARHDFREGVRALLVDRDNSPVWDPKTPEAVSAETLDAIFSALPQGEGWTPLA